MDPAERIEALVHQWQNTFNLGEPLPLDELCRDCPGLLPELRKRVAEILQQMPAPHMDELTEITNQSDDSVKSNPVSRPDSLDDPTARRNEPILTPDYGSPGGEQRFVPSDMPRSAGKYVIQGEIARGGMGAVLRALDPDFGRTLAVKVMLKSSQTPWAHRRFLEEARITGQLQHPGVPPVHDMGYLEDGRPYFAMKLIQGRTLLALLRERERQRKSGIGIGSSEVGAAERARDTEHADLSRFVGIFAHICHTLAYAHSFGVIHRDLKPANVMVGAFDDVQVMDWGLAKPLASGESHDAGVAETMGPTGEPTKPANPFDDPDDPTLISADDSMDSLMPRTKDTSSTHTRQGEVMGTPSYIAPEQARGELESVDERSDVFGLGSILCVILTGRPAFWGRTARDSIAMAKEANLTECWNRLDSCGADKELVEIAKNCLAADINDRPRNAGEVAEAVEEYQAQVQERLKTAELERAGAEAKAGEERKRRQVEQQRRKLTIALAGAILLLVGVASAAAVWHQSVQAQIAAENARRIEEKNSTQKLVMQEVSAALAETKKRRVDLHSRLGDEKQFQELLNDTLLWEKLIDTADESWRRADSVAGSNPAILERPLQAKIQLVRHQLGDDRSDLRLARKLDEIHLLSTSFVDGEYDPSKAGPKYAAVFKSAGLDVVGGKMKEIAERIRRSPIRDAFIATLDHWAGWEKDQKLAGRLAKIALLCDPNPWRKRFQRAKDWSDKKQLAQFLSEVDSQKERPQTLVMMARRLNAAGLDPAPMLRSAVANHPRDFWLHLYLGKYSKDDAERVSCFRVALAMRPNASVAHYNLGVAMQNQRDFKGAARHFQQALAIDPDDYHAHNNLGMVFKAQTMTDKAVGQYQKALAIKPEYPLAHYNLGIAYEEQFLIEKAVKSYQRAIDTDPNYFEALYNLGSVLNRELGKLDDAAIYLRRAVKIKPKDAKAHCQLGRTLMEQKKYNEALEELKLGHALGSKQKGWNLPSAQWVEDCKTLIKNKKRPPMK